MSKCRNCNIEILDESHLCPLCHSVLEQTEELENMYPDARLKNQKLLFASRVFLFVAIVMEVVFLTIDFQVENQIRWSILVGVGLLYAYLVLRYAIIGTSGYRAKTVVLVIFAVLVAIAIDFVTGYRGWSVDYAISGAILLVDATILVLMFANLRNWQSYLMLQIMMLIFSLIPLVLYLFGIESNGYMAVLPLAVSAFLFLGTTIIGGRRAVQELYRRFHV